MFKELSHKAFAVGGSIRNELMGLPAKDFDFVVEDTTEEEFLTVFPDAKKVGVSFPVYLLKDASGEEHEVALARTEISTGTGYQDFEFIAGVSIHDDLARRDFSMNSIAKNFKTGEIVDPHNGHDDIKSRIIRTINDKFVIEDPLRVYRLARFVAEFEFTVEEKTAEIAKRDARFIANVLPERVYVELKKVYERAEKPSLFFTTLLDLGVLKYHFKPLFVMSKISSGPNKFHNGKTAFEHAMDSFDYAKAHGYSFDVALAGLFHDTGKGVSKKAVEGEEQHHINHETMSYAINKKFVDQHRFTSKQSEMIITFGRNHMYFHLLTKVKNPVKLVRFFKKIRKHADEYIQAANTDHPLNEEQIKILENLKRVFKETTIDIPKHIHDKGKEAITAFVEQAYVKTYKSIS
jgi:tRNA nucleotidyltransferase (CCA-adding enzyme)